MFNGDEDVEHLNLKRFEDILSLLLSAGYFRARAEGLSMFDKVRRLSPSWTGMVSLSLSLFFGCVHRRASITNDRSWVDCVGALRRAEKR